MATDKIIIKGACEHNLKCIDVEIPRDKLVVITGISGSGKSTLAFDTIYAEGQRRYVESLSAYARQFLEQMEKPDVESIEGLEPGNFHRAENHQQKSPLNRRHGNRDIRLPPPSFRQGRAPVLLQLRQGNRRPDGYARWSTRSSLLPAGSQDQPALPHGAGAEGGVPQGA